MALPVVAQREAIVAQLHGGYLDGEWIGPGEVKALQVSLKAQFETVRVALQRCATSGTFTPDKTPGEWGAWQSLKTRVESYVAETPALLSTVAQYGRGEALQKEVISWHDKSRALGCDAGPAPPAPTTPDDPILSTAGLSKLAMLAIVFLFFLKKK